ncbi:MAG: hypothetical protein ACOZB3_03845 [Calditrichota bacterium]
MEGWQKVILTGSGYEAFRNSAHALECRICHGGRAGQLTKEEAHDGMIADPSEISVNQCGMCHQEIANNVSHSLHTTMKGYHTLFEARTGRALTSDPHAYEAYNAECNKCHASCGSCHISRPKSVGGGFIQGHNIRRTPDMTNQCIACHGSRIGPEYTGENAGYRADVHYIPNAMHCKACHSGQKIHGDGTEYANRYDVDDPVSCRDCHSPLAANSYHTVHGDDLQCQVCHSQAYKNCAECHAGDGIQEPSWIDFKIGRNPIPDQRPGEYVVLRHIPVSENTYTPWGIASPNYASLPTYKYATPHNIVRWTAQTDTSGGQSCNAACHLTPNTPEGFFLRQVDLDQLSSANERQANAGVIVPDGPPPW